jgi:hypothetical protein
MQLQIRITPPTEAEFGTIFASSTNGLREYQRVKTGATNIPELENYKAAAWGQIEDIISGVDTESILTCMTNNDPTEPLLILVVLNPKDSGGYNSRHIFTNESNGSKAWMYEPDTAIAYADIQAAQGVDVTYTKTRLNTPMGDFFLWVKENVPEAFADTKIVASIAGSLEVIHEYNSYNDTL